MRRGLILLAIAAWLAGHAWLWTLLPPLPRWKVPAFVPHAVAFTADSRSLVTADLDSVCVFDVASGRREQAIPRPGKRPDYDDAVAVLTVSPTDRRAIVYDSRGGRRPYLFALDTGTATPMPAWENLVPSTDPCIGFLPVGRVFQIDATYPKIDLFMRLYDPPAGPVRQFSIGWRLDMPPTFSADGRRAAVLLRKRREVPATVLIIDLEAGRVIRKLDFDRAVVVAALAPNGRTLAVSADPILEAEGQSLPDVELWDVDERLQSGGLGPGFIAGWTTTDRLVVADHQHVRVGTADGSEVARWPVPEGLGLYTLALTPDGRHFSAWQRHDVPDIVHWLPDWFRGRYNLDSLTFSYVVHDTNTGRELASISADQLKPVAVAPDGSALATTADDGLRLWDVPPRKPGGYVLGVMITEVGMLIGWTAWRRRRASRRQPDVGRIVRGSTTSS